MQFIPQTAPFERGQIFPLIFYAELSLPLDRSSVHGIAAGYDPVLVLATVCTNVAVGNVSVFTPLPSMLSVQLIQVQRPYHEGKHISTKARQIY